MVGSGARTVRRLAAALALASTVAGAAAQDTAEKCQDAYAAETAKANAEHLREAKACRGDGPCIAQANSKKAEALKKAGTTRHQCNQTALKADTPKLDPRGQWSGDQRQAIFTDLEGRRWSFARRIVEGQYTFELQQGQPPLINKLGELREAYGMYAEIHGRSPERRLRGRLLP